MSDGVTTIGPLEIQVWTADPRQFHEARPGDLDSLLDEAEQSRAKQFRLDADRRAYSLAHALRRAALARALGVAPAELTFSEESGGKPLLAAPLGQAIFFSHSRTRTKVACAITRAAAVGIDVETDRGGEVDFDLLAPYLWLPDARGRAADAGEDASCQFRFYWTALEAFWKACGTGLVSTQPRIRCIRTQAGTFEVRVDEEAASTNAARLFQVPSCPTETISVALRYCETNVASRASNLRLTLFHCNSSMEICNSSTP